VEFQELSARDIQKDHGLRISNHFNQDRAKGPLKAISAILAIGLLGGSFCQKVDASPVVGSIDFGGVVTYDTMSLATATRVNIWNSSFVLQDSGDFSSIAPGTHVTMAAPWIFNPSTATPSLWNVGGFTFDLTSAAIAVQDSHFLNVTGIGTVTGNGFDPTPGIWTFSSSNSNGSTSTTFGFQATTDPVPEPSTLALFGTGIGIVSLHLLRRKLRVPGEMKRTQHSFIRR
jgi:hypothetical protein